MINTDNSKNKLNHPILQNFAYYEMFYKMLFFSSQIYLNAIFILPKVFCTKNIYIAYTALLAQYGTLPRFWPSLRTRLMVKAGVRTHRCWKCHFLVSCFGNLLNPQFMSIIEILDQPLLKSEHRYFLKILVTMLPNYLVISHTKALMLIGIQ